MDPQLPVTAGCPVRLLMRATGILCGSFLLVVVLAGAARAQGVSTRDGIHWTRSLSEAIQKSVSTRRLVMVHFNKDADESCNELARVSLRDPRVIALSRQFISVVCSPDDHRIKKHSREPCPRFGGVLCKEHQKAWKATSLKVSHSPRPTAPQFVFLQPDRWPILRRHGSFDAEDLLEAMNRAIHYARSPKDTDGFPVERFQKLMKEARSKRIWERGPAIKAIAVHEFPLAMKFMARQVLPEAGEWQRQLAIKAMKDAANANALPLIIPLLKEQSGQLRRNAVFALRNLEMIEAVPPMLACYRRENTSRMKALILRVTARLDGANPELHRVHGIAMVRAGPNLRVHAVRACLDLDIRPRTFKLLTELVRSATSMTIQGVACFVATEILLRSRYDAPAEDPEEPGDGYERQKVSRNAKGILAMESRLLLALRHVAEHGRTKKIRSYARECLAALAGNGSSFRSGVKKFHDDEKDEVFKEY